MLACLLTNTHKVTIDLYNFLEILMKVYIKVAEIQNNVEFWGIYMNTFISTMYLFRKCVQSVGRLQWTLGQGPSCPTTLFQPS